MLLKRWKSGEGPDAGERSSTNVQTHKVSAWRVLQSRAEEILFMRHQRMAVGGRREGDEVV